MKTQEQVIKGETMEAGTIVQEARGKVSQIERGAAEAEEAKRNLEIELMKAEAAAQRKEEAERQGKETKEKIGGMA